MTTALNLQPETVAMPERRIIGLMRRYTMATRQAIPGQWADYDAEAGQRPGPMPEAWYGVCANFGPEGDFDYLCGTEMQEGAVPEGWAAITLPAGNWAVFATMAHISAMPGMWEAIYRDWVGTGRITLREGPSVEHYPPAFNGATGMGGYAIWLPVQ
jgi:AraC family transcriptional regulator